jgi:calcium-dependent protein kinase
MLGAGTPAKGKLILGRSGGLTLLPDNTGKQPKDKYKIDEKPIGTGAFGTVKKCTVKNGEKVLAMKTINKAAIQDTKVFTNEVEINAALDHPNICKLYEVFEDSRCVYLCLELCHGGEMFDKIIAQGFFPEPDASHCILQIMRAVAYMHSNSIAHRDLKPENFMLVEKQQDKDPVSKNTIKVIDFGIAKRYTVKGGQTVPMRTKAGTAYYVSPEVQAGNYTEKCDVWSCGVILYILLSGQPPFAGNEDKEIMRKARQGKIDFGIPELKRSSNEVKKFIQDMCQLDLSKRLSASQCLVVPWVQNPKAIQSQAPSREEAAALAGKLKKFCAVNKFKKTALHIIAYQMDDGRIKKLREAFTRMDTNSDGVLTLGEMKAGMESAGMKDMKDIQKIFETLDADKSGSVGYTEFLTALIDQADFKKKETLWEAFRTFDKNGDGKISLAELSQMLKDPDVAAAGKVVNNDEEVKKLFDQVDTDGSGGITFDEFEKMMMIN